MYKQFSDSANIYEGTETNNEFLGENGAELWTSLGDGEVPGSFYFHGWIHSILQSRAKSASFDIN